jgi:hypothetical protein
MEGMLDKVVELSQIIEADYLSDADILTGLMEAL